MNIRRISIFLIATFMIVLSGKGFLFSETSQPSDIIRPGCNPEIAYLVQGDKEIYLDLYLPAGKTPAPVIVYIHGGALISGSRTNMFIDPDLVTSRGYALATIDYRLLPEANYPAQIHDCKAAIRWLRAHAKEYGLNTDKIGVWGESAGGYLAILLGTTNGNSSFEGNEGNETFSSRVDAVCDMYGPIIFTGLPNPTDYISSTTPPFLIMHGKKDTFVPWQQSETLNRELTSHMIKSELVLFDNADHGHLSPEILYSVKNMNRVLDFFDKTIREKK
ncbi:MAG TPA: alpha/beta hydrolase [Spirochaetota bacterium]